MQQILFHLPTFDLPFLRDWFPAGGIPVHGFGVMLFVTFLACVWFLGWRSRRTGTNMPRDKAQDLVIAVFVGGLIGARLTYMIQYGVPLREIHRIWEGGIVLYGGIVVGCLAFYGFYYAILRRANVTFWRLADVSAPGLALGIALGRIGCLLNGCCYGHVAPEGCPSAGFPLMTCPAREIVVDREGYQTPTGFTVKPGTTTPQSVVIDVEPRSAAERAGLQPDDRIVGINGQANVAILMLTAEDPAVVAAAVEFAISQGAEAYGHRDKNPQLAKVKVLNNDQIVPLKTQLSSRFHSGVRVYETDLFTYLLKPPGDNWPRGEQSLTLDVVHLNGDKQQVGPFTPRTLGLHPTQVYETISMILLVFFLLAYYPFRKYDGQLFTLFLVGYAIHRFLNEALRNDTDIVGIPALHMSLSQNISLLMLLGALLLELAQRRWGRLGSEKQPASLATN